MYLFKVITFCFIGSVTSQSDVDDVFSSCGGDIRVQRGTITSPDYPSNYANDLTCDWWISSEHDDVRVEISIDVIDIENARNCQYDFLSLRFTDQAEQKFCSNRVDGNPYVGALPTTVSFSSDGSVGGRGFTLSFKGGCFTPHPYAHDYYVIRCISVLSPCLSDPCQNGGTCDYDATGYNCQCAPGWTGENCEQEVNECSSNPCSRGGTCFDDVNSFRCQCAVGLSGPTCDVITDNCLILEPCQNSGVCSNTEDGYQCACADGFTGMNCTRDVDECSSAPCLNGGSCDDVINGFRCFCLSGYFGDQCDVTESTTAPLDSQNDVGSDAACSEYECFNGGSCVTLTNDDPICVCLDDYEGGRCQNSRNASTFYVPMVISTSGFFLCLLLLAALIYYVIKRLQQSKEEVKKDALEHPQAAKQAWDGKSFFHFRHLRKNKVMSFSHNPR
ncbi:uncharacterized protein LOC143453257 isoform X1 [Clavelina lepadiformis]|uniref:uncharacterized protein LOC143453257 isoform X1 n=1 Tax=Clavelina lepadiformis TaxID=159417 RepID=UPI0040422D51